MYKTGLEAYEGAGREEKQSGGLFFSRAVRRREPRKSAVAKHG
jgi:hypothetical protein